MESEYRARRYYQDQGVADSYDAQFHVPRLAHLRARLYGWLEERTFLHLLRDTPEGGLVLDIAAGTGRYLGHLLARGHRAGGVDISEQMLRVARRRLGGNPNLVFLEVVDAAALPFADGQFDGVTCMRLFHLVPAEERRKMLREVRRVGRGWAILYFGMTSRWLALRRRIRNLLSGHVADPYPLDLRELRAELGAVGMKLEKVRWVARGFGDGLVARVSWDTTQAGATPRLAAQVPRWVREPNPPPLGPRTPSREPQPSVRR